MSEESAPDRDAASNADQTDSPLLRLPPELRTKIFTYVSDTLTVEGEHIYLREIERSGSALLLVCRQINREAASVVESAHILSIPTRSAAVESRELRYHFWQPMSTVLTLEVDGLHIMGEMHRKLRFFRARGVPLGWADSVWVRHMFPNLRFVNVVPVEDRGKAFEVLNSEQVRPELLRIVRGIFDRPDLEVTFF